MSGTTKDTEMELCIARKRKKKDRKNSFVTFFKKPALTDEKKAMLLENFSFLTLTIFPDQTYRGNCNFSFSSYSC